MPFSPINLLKVLSGNSNRIKSEYKNFPGAITSSKCSYLVATEVVDDQHADEVQEHAEALKGDHGEAEGRVLLSHTRCVACAERTAFSAGQTPPGRFPGFIRVRSPV